MVTYPSPEPLPLLLRHMRRQTARHWLPLLDQFLTKGRHCGELQLATGNCLKTKFPI